MKFDTKGEFEAWLQNYSRPYKDKKTFREEAVLSKDYIVWDKPQFIMDDGLVYVINRTQTDKEHYYICYNTEGAPNTMWWTMISNLYAKYLDIKEFDWGPSKGWPSMEGAKIWIIGGASEFESFINWHNENPLEVKS